MVLVALILLVFKVEFPVFQDLPQLPTPIGPLFYTRFFRISLLDRLTLLPLMAAVIDFDNTDVAWRRYDSITARELFKQFGCSERLYMDVISPLLQVGLFAPAEQCSAAAMLGMLYYLSLAHHKDFNVVWSRGTIRDKIFGPWMDLLRTKGCRFLHNRKLMDFFIDEETGCISDLVCSNEIYKADAVILAVGVSTIQEIIKDSAALCTSKEFLKVLKLAGIDVLSAKLFLDRKVNIPQASNACSGNDDSFGWTFFNLNALHDEHKESPVTVIQADFYYASELLRLGDDEVVKKVMTCLSQCIKDFETASVMDKQIERFPKSMTHFFPGSWLKASSFKTIESHWILDTILAVAFTLSLNL
uniref:Uncharacterized protein LOC8283661 isoform X1 n=1 Tax=Rhizophora mucronata TaxID=61149 RepID=A0A2P2MG77_RHIMU